MPAAKAATASTTNGASRRQRRWRWTGAPCPSVSITHPTSAETVDKPRALSSGAVTAVDWVIVAFCALLALYGYTQGFIVGVLSLIGFAAGAFIGTRLGPLLLPGGSHSQYAPLFGLLGA